MRTDTLEAVRIESILPRGERILVQQVRKPEKTAGGIVLPEQSQEISQLGEILAVGDGARQKGLEKGQIVIFSIYSASPCVSVSGNESDLMFVREQDVLAVVEQ